MTTPHICLWKDLTLRDIEGLERMECAEDVRRALFPLLSPEESVCQLRASALLDLYYYAVHFCWDNHFNREQMSCFISIVKEIHRSCVETSLGNVDECYRCLKELLLCHAVHRPPFSIAVFTQQQLPLISHYVLSTYLRHFKLYKYVFTPQVCVDLTISYDDESESIEQETEKNDGAEGATSSPAAENDGAEGATSSPAAENNGTEGATSSPAAENDGADVKHERPGGEEAGNVSSAPGPLGGHMDHTLSPVTSQMPKLELQNHSKGGAQTTTSSPGGGTEGGAQTTTSSPGGGTEGGAQTTTRSPGGGTEGGAQTTISSPRGGTEGGAQTTISSPGGGTEGGAQTTISSPGGGTEGGAQTTTRSRGRAQVEKNLAKEA